MPGRGLQSKSRYWWGYRLALIALLLLLCACSQHSDTGNPPVDISAQFSLATSPWNTHDPKDVLASRVPALDFKPVVSPRTINNNGEDMWLKAILSPTEDPQPAKVLEIPGHLFRGVDVWFELASGQVVHQYAGTAHPYADRPIKHSGVAFNIPHSNGGPIKILIRFQTRTPVNFAALVWDEGPWNEYLFNQRGWYGIFFGAMLILCLYNIFLAFTLRDKSYFYYVGYILSLSFVVVLYSGLAEEYLWPQGKTRTFILMASGFGIFFGVGFVNNFLRIKERVPLLYRAATVVSVLALIFGISHAMRIHFVPSMIRGTLMHLLLLFGCLYFIGVSIISYLMGMKQARFLALSMVALLSGMVIYLMYTYGLITYDVYLIHALEMGSLVEGVLLSLALTDRINLLSQEKDKAEKEALESQRTFSKRLIHAQEIDREKFSNTLHDSIGHGMLVLKQNLERISNPSIPNRVGKGIDCSGEIRDQARYCGEIMDDVRRMSHDLHPHLLKRLGLKMAAESTLDRAFSSQGIEWQADIEDLPGNIDSDREITIYRVIQECVNNILKHANASEVIFSLRVDNENILVNIKDDGDGFDVTEQVTGSLGLNEMKGRIKLFGGWFEVESAADAGTHVRFGIPVS